MAAGMKGNVARAARCLHAAARRPIVGRHCGRKWRNGGVRCWQESWRRDEQWRRRSGLGGGRCWLLVIEAAWPSVASSSRRWRSAPAGAYISSRSGRFEIDVGNRRREDSWQAAARRRPHVISPSAGEIGASWHNAPGDKAFNEKRPLGESR